MAISTQSNNTALDVPFTKFAAVLCDLDGVLIDSEPLHEQALARACEVYGIPLQLSECEEFKGVREEQVAARILARHERTEITVADFVACKSRYYVSMFDEITVMAGAVAFLQGCQKRGWRLGLTTSALHQHAMSIMQRLELASYFTTIVTSRDVVNGKPHPEPYIKTAQLLEIEPQSCLVIEDSVLGVRSGKAAGCCVAGLISTFAREDLQTAGADVIVSSFAELTRITAG